MIFPLFLKIESEFRTPYYRKENNKKIRDIFPRCSTTGQLFVFFARNI